MLFWWRCGESDPGPKSLHRDFLHAYLAFEFFAPRYTGEPWIDESVMTIALPDDHATLSVFLTPLAEGTENLGAMRRLKLCSEGEIHGGFLSIVFRV